MQPHSAVLGTRLAWKGIAIPLATEVVEAYDLIGKAIAKSASLLSAS